MNSLNQYKVNSLNIIHETIDDEVVIVDLEKGFYYSLRSTAAQIWLHIIAGASESEIMKYLSDQYKTDLAQIETPVKDFIRQLVDENIISQIAAGSMRNSPSGDEPKLYQQTKQAEFTVPVMEKFTDMSELLLLDPIHEVDETGWPNMAPDLSADES